MQLTFESLAELQDFVQWVQAERSSGLTIEAAPQATIVVKDLPIDGAPLEVMAPGETQSAGEATDKPARKRRTKAEMEAARAIEIAAEASPATSVESVAESASIPAVAAPAEPSASAEFDNDPRDAPDFIKSRLAERPEVSQVEHLNLARTFIGKHGMEKYNASFPLAGLTPNVMGYSPADCATHAAALDFLSLE